MTFKRLLCARAARVRPARLQSCLDLQNRTWWQQQRHASDVAATVAVLPAKNLPWRPCAVFKLNDKNSKFPSITQGFPWRMSNEYRVSTSTIFSSSCLCIFMSSRSPLNGTVSVPTNSFKINFFFAVFGFLLQYINPILTSLCHLIYCHGEKIYPCLIGSKNGKILST